MQDATGRDATLPQQLLAELEAARFIARASATLAELVDYESTLERISSLAVPTFADWFGVHIRESGGGIRRLAVRHKDPAMQALVVEMYRLYPPAQPPAYGALRVIETGEPLFVPQFAAVIPKAARDATHAQMLAALQLRSFICVPMRSRHGIVGALTFATAESGRDYSGIQLAAAQDLAARCAIAIENARLLEELRQADRRKDEFLAMLGHELRNPLAPIRNAVEIIRSRPGLTPEVVWLNGVIERQVRQLARLVDDLLDVSRITRGRIELRRELATADGIVAAAVEAVKPAIEAAGHRLVLDVPAQPLTFEADAMRLSQALGNLLNNAAKYTPRGGRIDVSVSRDGPDLVMRVADNGIGIPPEMLDRIFEMFVQVPGARRRPSEAGMGIGLTLVKRLVELHGGTVQAHSDGPGRGSTFILRLPLAVSPEGLAERAMAATRPGGALAPDSTE